MRKQNYGKVRYDFGDGYPADFNIKHLGIAADANQWNRDDVILNFLTLTK